ncbi:4-amino-4-deoxy-L-arabinose-phospho-UDP flippase [Rahnella victoriana]|uniref:EamA family transporter n=1 Tax=Rahnella victoriana TaxID=1510570 RepID=UPI000BB16D5D|nr:EamA family transporter [Rahnella victoriana]PBI78644.1 4-amino-4-deoxy-L-arabinose-phospho-UDP flippase [Rahnella victoriana]
MFYIVAFICVLGIAVGQILFKLSAIELHKTGSIFAQSTLIMMISAFALYGLTTLAWIWVLQKIDLGKAYPLMAFAFVLVPIGSYLILGEKFNQQYFIGVSLIIVGIILAVRA